MVKLSVKGTLFKFSLLGLSGFGSKEDKSPISNFNPLSLRILSKGM